jgi:hypothetical protein
MEPRPEGPSAAIKLSYGRRLHDVDFHLRELKGETVPLFSPPSPRPRSVLPCGSNGRLVQFCASSEKGV